MHMITPIKASQRQTLPSAFIVNISQHDDRIILSQYLGSEVQMSVQGQRILSCFLLLNFCKTTIVLEPAEYGALPVWHQGMFCIRDMRVLLIPCN